MGRSEDNLQELVVCFHQVDPRGQITLAFVSCRQEELLRYWTSLALHNKYSARWTPQKTELSQEHHYHQNRW